MSKLLVALVCLSLLFGSGCGPVQSAVRRDEHILTYKKIFRQDKPEGVEVVHSFLVTYTPRIGVVTTPDFEIELIVSEQWIHETSKRLHLRKIEDTSSFIYKQVIARIEERANDWYVPKNIADYDVYYLYPTSIPYVHMLVDKELAGDDRYRVFVSKH